MVADMTNLFPPSRCCTALNCQSGVDLTVLMEQFLDGPEVDVDATWQEDGESMGISATTKGNLRYLGQIWGKPVEFWVGLSKYGMITTIWNSLIPVSDLESRQIWNPSKFSRMKPG